MLTENYRSRNGNFIESTISDGMLVHQKKKLHIRCAHTSTSWRTMQYARFLVYSGRLVFHSVISPPLLNVSSFFFSFILLISFNYSVLFTRHFSCLLKSCAPPLLHTSNICFPQFQRLADVTTVYTSTSAPIIDPTFPMDDGLQKTHFTYVHVYGQKDRVVFVLIFAASSIQFIKLCTESSTCSGLLFARNRNNIELSINFLRNDTETLIGIARIYAISKIGIIGWCNGTR